MRTFQTQWLSILTAGALWVDVSALDTVSQTQKQLSQPNYIFDFAITSLPEVVRPGVDIFSSKTMAVEQQRNFSGR